MNRLDFKSLERDGRLNRYPLQAVALWEFGMPISVHQFPCLSDNYGFLVRDEASGLAATIDTPESGAILREADKLGWKIALILNTHWHPDHAGGNADIKAATGATIFGPQEVTRISALDREVRDGDEVMLGETRFQVLDSGGHTLGHVAYYDAASHVAFVGDTLFALGCGRLFEGTPEQMWDSLQRLAALPDDTRVYCAHEYTASNARFALSVDGSAELKARADHIFAARERGEPTVPTTIGLEKATNPFLRAPLLAPALGAVGQSDARAFAAVRTAKDNFRG
jgi:hydroxyacylglutathione hydrolase